MKTFLWIFLGGGIGSFCRFFLSRTLQDLFTFTFPLGTLAVNTVGSFLAGFLTLALLDRVNAMDLRAFLVIGFMGGFTTFSAFSVETIELWKNGEAFKFASYLLLSVILSLGAAYGGMMIGRKL